MAFKHAKKKQTDWNIAGKNISDTAAPLYQKNLTRMDEYLSDPTVLQDMYMNKYFSTDSAQNNDFLRNYQRAMANTTGNNYSATSGGYSSSGQRAYDDNQRYWNDLGSRLQGNNVSLAYNMANQDYNNMLGANNSYYNAYQLGKAYSDVDQYNDMASQANKNWFSNIMSGVGGIMSNSGIPGVSTVGGVLSGIGNLTGSDAELQLNRMSGIEGDSRATDTTNIGNAFSTAASGIGTLADRWRARQANNTGTNGLFDSNSQNYWRRTL